MYMVYDVRDRLVFSQDGNLRGHGQWNATLYDALNRPVLTGLINYSGSFTDLQAIVTQKTTASASAPSSGLATDLTLSGVNDGTQQALRSITMMDEFESESGGEFVAEIVSSASDGQTTVVEGALVNNNPLPDGVNLYVLSQTAYDSYEGLPAPLTSSLRTAAINSQNFITTYNNAPAYAQEVKQSAATVGMVTWSKTRVLGSEQFITEVSLYDEKGRLAQVQTLNETGGLDVATTQYDFSGKVLRTHRQHQKGTATPIEVADKPTYDKIGRLVVVEKNLNNSGWKKLAQYEYNALGQVKKKILAPDYNGNAGLQHLDYEYNIQGWLLSMNRAYLKDKNSSGYTDRYFGFELGYDKGVSTPGATSGSEYQYNGTISTSVWKSKGDAVRRKYNLFYDEAGRLAKADFTQAATPEAGATWNTEKANFSVQGFAADNNKLAYDANGNLLTLVQQGIKGVTPAATLDALRYTYFIGTNKLQKVVDEANNGLSQLGDFSYQPKDKSAAAYEDYGYDANGNLVTDRNKDIGTTTGKEVASGGIVYNHLSLPTLITNAKGTLAYTYDADGNKLKKIFTQSTTGKVTTTLYRGGFIYVNDTLRFITHEEGRARPSTINGQPATFQWDYFVKDQLGNTRLVLTEEQRTDAYLVASMETATATTEEALYSNLSQTRTDKPAGYPNDSYTTPNDKVARVRGDGQKIGPALLLKVMAGDQFNLRVNSWYKTGGSTPHNPVNPITDVVTALSSAISTVSGKVTAVELSSSGVLSPEVLGFFNSQPAVSGTPKAYVNWILLDEQFHYVSSSSGAEPVGGDQVFTTHVRNNLPIDKNGYLYVYVSNETPNIDVYFDNLQVSHVKGPLLEETHYYPYGGVLQGISTKAANSITNPYQYQGEYSDYEEESSYHDFALRNYDPQLGRWLQQDPYDEFASPYVGMGNDPINYVDPEGGNIFQSNGALIGAIAGLGVGIYLSAKNDNPLYAFGGLAAGMALGYGIEKYMFNIESIPKEALTEVITMHFKHGFTDVLHGNFGKLDGHALMEVNDVVYDFAPGYQKVNGRDFSQSGFSQNIARMVRSQGGVNARNIVTRLNPDLSMDKIGIEDYYDIGRPLTFDDLKKKFGYTRVDLKISKTQLGLLEKSIQESMNNPSPYSLIGTRCAGWTAQMLRKAGVLPRASALSGWSPVPFRKYLKKLAISKTIYDAPPTK